ncbi:MAG: 16S rRNA (guanine(966)-N(2))-methyltransferase RsmD [Cytophagales bacterium]|nr:16S rRNA (guanine(966)-N(2))-methyltransferase RsmD [Cytophagales bacterium]
MISKRSPLGRAAAAPRGGAHSHGDIRIIGGQWKRSLLPVANKEGLRPTPNRVRETLFNWLGQDLTGLSVVDAFAGTGALGFEAASRNATSVLLCELDSSLCRSLLGLRSKLSAQNVHISQGDALAHLSRLAAQSVDGVFLDPPFGSDLFLPALQAASRIAKLGGFVYLESDRGWTDAELAPFELSITRQGRAGMVYYHLLQKG